jgi:hypothetical protein
MDQDITEQGAKKMWLASRQREKSIPEGEKVGNTETSDKPGAKEEEKKAVEMFAKLKKTPSLSSRENTKASSSKTPKSGKRESNAPPPPKRELSVFSKGGDKARLTASVLSKAASRPETEVLLVSQDHSLLHSWYTLDNNVNPPVYRLQKIRWDYRNKPINQSIILREYFAAITTKKFWWLTLQKDHKQRVFGCKQLEDFRKFCTIAPSGHLMMRILSANMRCLVSKSVYLYL